MPNAVDRIASRVASRIATDVGHRADLSLIDTRMAGSDLATVLVAFDKGVGNPSSEDISDFITMSFKGRIRPHMGTLKIHAGSEAVSLNVTQATVTRPIDDRERMIPNGPSRFIEARSSDVWEVADNGGTPVLYRVAEEDLESILAERKLQSSMSRVGKRAVSLASLDQGRPLPVVGAQVIFFNEYGEEKVGSVQSEADAHGMIAVRITGREENSRIHVNQVAEMVASTELDQNTLGKLRQYYAEAFGDAGYAEQLTSRQSVTGGRDELVAFLVVAGAMDGASALAWADTLRIASGKVLTTGPNEMILAMHNGIGYEWQVDVDKLVVD